VRAQLAPDPLVLYRVGRPPDPLIFPPLSSQGRGRFDDPLRRVPVLYAADSRRGAFMETLDQYRFDVATMAEIQSRTGGVLDEAPHRSFGRIPPSYFQRHIVAFRVAPGQRWLDVRSPATHAEVLRMMAAQFRDLDVGPRITLGRLLGTDYRIPRTFTQWAYRQRLRRHRLRKLPRPRIDLLGAVHGSRAQTDRASGTDRPA